MRLLGTSKQGMNKMYERPELIKAGSVRIDTPPRSQKALAHAVEDFYRQQFHPGGLLEELWGRIQHRLDIALQWDNILAKPVLPSLTDTKKLSLLQWCRATILPSVTNAVWSDCLLQLEPDLMDIFVTFDNESWKLNFQLPYFMARDMHQAKDKIIANFKRYLATPRDQRSGAAWFLQTLESEFRRLEIRDSDMAAMFVPPFWVYVSP